MVLGQVREVLEVLKIWKVQEVLKVQEVGRFRRFTVGLEMVQEIKWSTDDECPIKM